MATSLEPKCYPSADRDSKSTSARTSRIVHRNGTIASSPHRNRRSKRSSHLPQHRLRGPSNSFFSSRRAREEGLLAGDRRRGRTSATSDDTVTNSDTTGPRDLVARPDALHIIDVSEEGVRDESLGHRKRRLYQQPKSDQVQTIFAEQRGSGRGTGRDVRKPSGGLAEEKTDSGIGNISLPPPESPKSEHPVGTAYHPAESLDDSIFEDDLAAKNGTVRRKTMRTVSQDDYLLARGANPRTGVVTPSDHSGSSSAGGQEGCGMTGSSPPAKWRLKGDQWVSFGLDEPSPLPCSPYGSHGRRGARMLRIPPKLAQGRGNVNRMNDHIIRRHRMDRMKPAPGTMTLPQQAERQDNNNIRSFEEGQSNRIRATAFPSQVFSRGVDGSVKDMLVRRKPLGMPVTKPSVDKASNGNGLREASTETVITSTHHAGQFRSSSLPTPRKIRAFRYEDVNKALPALPIPKASKYRDFKEGSRSQTTPFSGLPEGDGTEGILGHARLNGHGSDKSLPCPPKNDIPLHSRGSEIVNLKRLPAMTTPLNINKSENRQHKASCTCHTEWRSTALDSKPIMAPTQQHLTQITGVLQRAEKHTPTIDHNVSYTKSSQSKVHSQIMNGDMTKGSKGTEARSEGQPSQSTTSPITTPIATAQTLPEDRLVSWSWREMPSPLRPGQQIANVATRPAMPGRAEGTHTVPQVSPQKGLPDQDQWRTSDGNVSATSTPVDRSPERDLIPPPLRLSNGKTKRHGWVGQVVTEYVRDAESPTTGYPHCQVTCSGAGEPNMQWSTQTQGNPSAGNIDPQVESSITHGFSQDMAEDHSGCCSRCCVVGYHGSCLGHGPPLRKGTATGFAGYLDATKEAFRNSMRLSRRIRTRTSVGGSHETETEEVAELETPMPWQMSGAVSLSTASEMDAQNIRAGVHPKTDGRGKRVASNGSNSSLRTMEVPSDASISAVIEALTVPFGALRMWLKKHPQLLALMHVAVLKLMEMSKHVLATAGLAYRVAYMYSKNGTISPGKHTTPSGFAKDCMKGVVYSLVLGAVFMMVGRVLALLAGACSWLIWSLSWVAWIVKAAGLGMLW